MIAIGNSPNTELDDKLLALRLLFQPWIWRDSSPIKRVEEWFKNYFNMPYAVAVDSGRSAEYLILKALEIGEGPASAKASAGKDEVLVQAFTCVAVPNSVIWNGATPIYVDIEKDSYNMDPRNLEKKITKKSKAIIVQHTFGIPANIEKIKEIATSRNLYLIEDCAHSLGATFDNNKIGTFGDAAFFSFGRDKVVSSVSGGMIITRNKELGERLVKFQRELRETPKGFIFRQLLHPVAFLFIGPLYDIGRLGRLGLLALQKLNLLTLPVDPAECKAGRPKMYPGKYNGALAILLLNQLKKLERYNNRRAEIAKRYEKELYGLPLEFGPDFAKASSGKQGRAATEVIMRYPIQTDKAEELWQFAKKNGVVLGRWYSHIVDPIQVDLEKVGYKIGSCPVAENVGKKAINLPTYPTMSDGDIGRVIRVTREYY